MTETTNMENTVHPYCITNTEVLLPVLECFEMLHVHDVQMILKAGVLHIPLVTPDHAITLGARITPHFANGDFVMWFELHSLLRAIKTLHKDAPHITVRFDNTNRITIKGTFGNSEWVVPINVTEKPLQSSILDAQSELSDVIRERATIDVECLNNYLFSQVMEKFKDLGECVVKFTSTESGFSLIGDDTGVQTNLHIAPGADRITPGIHAKYALEYLVPLNSLLLYPTSSMRLRYETDLPMMIEGFKRNNFEFTAFIAPRVDEDDLDDIVDDSEDSDVDDIYM